MLDIALPLRVLLGVLVLASGGALLAALVMLFRKVGDHPRFHVWIPIVGTLVAVGTVGVTIEVLLPWWTTLSIAAGGLTLGLVADEIRSWKKKKEALEEWQGDPQGASAETTASVRAQRAEFLESIRTEPGRLG